MPISIVQELPHLGADMVRNLAVVFTAGQAELNSPEGVAAIGDARIMAASLEMLQALQAIRGVRPVNWDDPELASFAAAWRAVDAAIGKAMGL